VCQESQQVCCGVLAAALRMVRRGCDGVHLHGLEDADVQGASVLYLDVLQQLAGAVEFRHLYGTEYSVNVCDVLNSQDRDNKLSMWMPCSSLLAVWKSDLCAQKLGQSHFQCLPALSARSERKHGRGAVRRPCMPAASACQKYAGPEASGVFLERAAASSSAKATA